MIHKNGKQKETKNFLWHLHLTMVKLGRSPPGSVFYMTTEFQIQFKLVGKWLKSWNDLNL